MELQTAIEILEYHQEWRLGKREDMIHEPKKLTEALDIVLSEVKKFRLGAVISCVCPNEIKTGTVAIHCCNLCGKPDEDWWGKHCL